MHNANHPYALQKTMKKRPKILAIDIETAPHTAYVWGLFKQTVPISRLVDTGRVMCFAWKWLREQGGVQFASEAMYSRDVLLKRAHDLLDEADIVVTYNGKKFDIPTLNKEFFEHGYAPPAPYKQVDLYRTARSQFRFASNKMDHLAHELGIKTKIRHQGFDLWVQCMEKDPKAWKTMERYNKRDVLILDKLYNLMLPWIKDHPNVNLFHDDPEKHLLSCPSCGSDKVQSRGFATSKSFKYRRFQCTSCGSWSRDRLAEKAHDSPEKVTCHA